ncbi:hypothetical protein [Aquifex sp.]
MEQKGKGAEELLIAFKEYDLGRKKFKVLTGKDYRMFHYILKFYEKERRITPFQEKFLKEVLRELKKVEGYNVKVPSKMLKEFLKSVEVKAKGVRGKGA